MLYVKRQTEKKVTERLQALGITVYLPTITVVRQWSDRKKKGADSGSIKGVKSVFMIHISTSKIELS